MNWFYQTSAFITMPLFVGLFVVVSCAIVLVLRPVVPRLIGDPKQWDRVLGHIIGTFGVFFGILLALVAVSVYENYADAHAAALEEASEVGVLYRATTGLPDEVGDEMRGALDEYVHLVIDQDWPAQRAGVIPESSEAATEQFEALMHGFNPQSPQQQAEFVQVLASFDDFIEARRARIDATTLELPPLFWLVIWVGAAINAVLIAFIDIGNRRLHLVMAGLLALFIGLVIFVTADMDHPYAGSISVGPGAFERLLEQVIDRS
ncbi:bestrophin-like domain [Agromyces bauzanensis]